MPPGGGGTTRLSQRLRASGTENETTFRGLLAVQLADRGPIIAIGVNDLPLWGLSSGCGRSFGRRCRMYRAFA